MANDKSIYPFEPNKLICIVMAGLFGASAICHLLQTIRTKTWFNTALIVGAFMMTLGYVARYFSAKSPSSQGPFIMQSLLIILPPSLYAATIYIIYGRIALFVNDPRASIIRSTRVTKIFVVGDVAAFFMQAGGGGMMAQAKMEKLGQKVILIGLFVQLAFFGIFVTVALIFWKRTHKSPARFAIHSGKHSWHALLMLLLAAAVVIILRCVFRVLEFAQGRDGYLASREVFLYLFDAVPMLSVQVMFHFIHPGDVFPPDFIANKLSYDSDQDTMHLHERL